MLRRFIQRIARREIERERAATLAEATMRERIIACICAGYREQLARRLQDAGWSMHAVAEEALRVNVRLTLREKGGSDDE